MNRRAAIIDMLARHRSKGDERDYKKISMEFGKLSSELLAWMLDDEQLARLKKLESDSNGQVA